MNNALIEIKNHVFRHSVLKRVEGSLSYGKSKSAIWFLKAWINFVEKINAIRQFLVGVSFVWKKTRARDFVHVLRSTPRNAATEFIFLMQSITRVLFILIVLNFGKNFFWHTWTTFTQEVFYTWNFSRYFLSAKLEKRELRRATICYWISIKNRLFKAFKGSYRLEWYFLHVGKENRPNVRPVGRRGDDAFEVANEITN